ncbi:CBS domain-containing protein [Gluconacetobacter sacchari]|uniref:CBS domain-containing protein n=2 Tax=Gluconacetobacter sacchari TaxID=92759 RepID=A0A7W4ID27_9PROT|nr:CBS domain-containing protein [Gluconacetobacter sacchari]MBB2160537.1 CBS domain-containing protein [Gluconacetobacter sacchari]GBQ32985.1 putative cystathionine-beta-synthase O [Gluconacetobacter sacchari DSM 12717]
MTATVLQALEHKGRHLFTVREDTPIREIANLMTQNRIGAVPVLDAHAHLAGLVSERALVSALAGHGMDVVHLSARDIMARNVPTTTLDEDILKVGRRMTDFRTRHLPIIDNGALVGIVSIGDIVKFRVDEAERLASAMQDYVWRSDHASVGH